MRLEFFAILCIAVGLLAIDRLENVNHDRATVEEACARGELPDVDCAPTACNECRTDAECDALCPRDHKGGWLDTKFSPIEEN